MFLLNSSGRHAIYGFVRIELLQPKVTAFFLFFSGIPIGRLSQLALIISCYLGVAGETGNDVKVLVGGVAALCGGVRKDVLKYLGDNSAVLKTSALRP